MDIAGAVREGLSLWKVLISTRQQAYERKMDKRKQKAIQIAEMAFEKMSVYFMSTDEKARKKLQDEIYKLREKFNKFD